MNNSKVCTSSVYRPPSIITIILIYSGVFLVERKKIPNLDPPPPETKKRFEIHKLLIMKVKRKRDKFITCGWK